MRQRISVDFAMQMHPALHGLMFHFFATFSAVSPIEKG
jgi:hypothetical protein